MRITREILLNNVRDAVVERTRTNRGVIAAYLCGSLLEDSYLLGGTTDLDIVFIHNDKPASEREIIRLTDEVHLDLAFHLYRDYRQTRTLRVHTWLGPTVKTWKILYDPQHFLDFTQASVRGQYDRADHVLERARQLAGEARRIWLDFHNRQVAPGPQAAADYLRAVGFAANAIASLSGGPLTERRFLLNFPARADAAGKPGLSAGLLGLLGAPNLDNDTFSAWLPLWESAYQAVPAGSAPPRLHPYRLAYYRQPFRAFLGENRPQVMLWPLLRTWVLAINHLDADAPEVGVWRQAFEYLGLAGSGFIERIAALDAYLDLVEETLELWGRKAGE